MIWMPKGLAGLNEPGFQLMEISFKNLIGLNSGQYFGYVLCSSVKLSFYTGFRIPMKVPQQILSASTQKAAELYE